jgi:hypothetical protein
LSHLRGILIISQLENAIEPRDASDAKLSEKHDLTTLCLEWSVNIDDSQDRRSEFDVLSMLQPHNALNELTIRLLWWYKISNLVWSFISSYGAAKD